MDKVKILNDAISFLRKEGCFFSDIEDAFVDYYVDSGSFGSVYSFDEKILKVRYDDLSFVDKETQGEIDKEGKKLTELQSVGLFPKIHEYDINYILMEKVEGKPLWCLTKDEVSAIDFSHWINLINGLHQIAKIGYRPIDVSSNNIFWNENGFQLIDVGLYLKDFPLSLHTPTVFKEQPYYFEIYKELKELFQFDEKYVEIALQP